METIAQKELGSQEELLKSAQKDVEDHMGDESIRRSSGKRLVEKLEKVSESL